MLVFILPLLVAWAASLSITPAVRKLAIKYELQDPPQDRKIHANEIPHLGGIAIFISFLVGFSVFWLIEQELVTHLLDRFWGVLAGGLVITLVGIYDDLKGTNCYQKLTGQTLAALLVIWSGSRVDIITNPFGPNITLGMFAIPVTIFWIVAITNAINLIDGLDGLAAGVSIIICFTLFLIAFQSGNPESMNVRIMILTLILIGSLLGFLRYNFNPATIFMGDTGSLFLGFAIACISLEGSYNAPTTVAVLVPIIALGVPIIDMMLAVYRRASTGKHPFKADKEHIHHRLLDFGFSHKAAVITIYFLTIVFCLFAILMTAATSRTTAVLLIVIGAIVFIGVRRLGYFEFKALAWKKKKAQGHRHGNKVKVDQAA